MRLYWEFNYCFGIGQRLGGRKRKRENERDEEKPKEVIHVRAKRGEATDSHSLAERVCFLINWFAYPNWVFCLGKILRFWNLLEN